VRTFLTLLLCIVCAAGASRGGVDDEIKKRQAELQNLRDQIREYEQRIAEQRQTEAATLDVLDSYDKKATLLRRLITKLRREEDDLQRVIAVTRATLERLETQLAFLKDHYARYVVSVYKGGPIRDMELLLTSRSINQFSIRNEYLKRFTAQRKADAEKIKKKQQEVAEVQARAQQELTEERRLIAEKGAEEDRLAMLADDRRDVLSQVRRDRRTLQREMERKSKAAKDLENIIASLIEQERIKSERDRERVLPEAKPVPPGGGFMARKGKLRWPVREGAVVAHFGPQRNPTLRTVTQNNGIDISVKAGSPVVSVAEGEVSRIWWLPSYGNLVILSHANGFRTIYTHLADIRVVEGERIGEGEMIGESGESLEGPRLHFEIWKDKEKQNPEEWLTPR